MASILSLKPRTAVLIVNWNGKILTRDCLESLNSDNYPLEDVFLVDNGSTDGSAEFIAQNYPRVNIIQAPHNLGFTGGNNLGLRQILEDARYDSVLLLNNDTLVTTGMIARLRDALQRDRVGIVQPKLVAFDRITTDNAGFFTDRFIMTKGRGQGKPIDVAWAESGFFYASGACMLVRSEVFREIGLLDEALFAYHEDVDFSWRVRLFGWSLLYVEEAVCFHKGSASAGKSPRKLGLIWRNRLRVMIKNYGANRLFLRLPAALVLSLAYCVGSAVRYRDMKLVSLYVQSLYWNIQKLPETLALRKVIQNNRRVDDDVIDVFLCSSYFELTTIARGGDSTCRK